jgi:hypothetical protein
MNILEGKSIKAGIFSFLYIFLLFLEPIVFNDETMLCLHAQELLQDTLSDTSQAFQTADSTEADSIKNVQMSVVYFPPFVLPDTVQGYILSNIGRYASANCPGKEVLRGAPMDLYFQFVEDSLLDYITPMFVNILEMNVNRTVVQVYREQYHISPGKNLIRLSVDVPSGNYQLIYGFYFRDQLTEKFPRLYGKRCRFRVVEAVSEQ